jgi:hypothetical protein
MIRKAMTVALVVLVAAFALTATGCRRVPLRETAGTQTDSVSYPLGGATKVDAELVMGVGELTLSGETSSTDALKGGFTYRPASWKPESSYTVTDGTGTLRVRQPSETEVGAFRDATNMWDLKLAGGVPTELDLTLGVGKNDVDLSRIDVRELRMVTGVGDTKLDMTGPRTNDVHARIEAGVGNLRIRLPRGVAVRVSGREEGLGDFSADGFVSQGGDWVNSAYAAAGPRIEIDLVRGVGNVTLELAD